MAEATLSVAGDGGVGGGGGGGGEVCGVSLLVQVLDWPFALPDCADRLVSGASLTTSIITSG